MNEDSGVAPPVGLTLAREERIMKAVILGAGAVVCAVCTMLGHGSSAWACVGMHASPPGVYVEGETSTVFYDGDEEQAGRTIQFSVSSGLAHPGSVSPTSAVANQDGDCYTTYTSGSSYGEVGIVGKDTTTQWTTGCTVVVFLIAQGDDLWYFNGATPANFPTRVTLTALGTQSGSFAWNVTQGTNKAGLESGGDVVWSLTLVDQNVVRLVSISPTAPGGGLNVHVGFAWNTYDVHTWETAVYTPHHLQLLEIHDFPYENGFVSQMSYRIVDQYNVWLPGRLIEINEAWIDPPHTSDRDDEKKWPRGAPKNWAHPADQMYDQIGVWGDKDPPPENPPPPDGPRVDHWGQRFYIGSMVTGLGAPVQDDVLQRYLDHARHENVHLP
jgi:hypothetical protein